MYVCGGRCRIAIRVLYIKSYSMLMFPSDIQELVEVVASNITIFLYVVCVFVCLCCVMAAFEVIASSQEECNAWIADIRAQMSTKRVASNAKSRPSLPSSKKREVCFWQLQGKHIVWKSWITRPGMTLENRIISEEDLMTPLGHDAEDDAELVAQALSPHHDDHDDDIPSGVSYEDSQLEDVARETYNRSRRIRSNNITFDQVYNSSSGSSLGGAGVMDGKVSVAPMDQHSRIISALNNECMSYVFYHVLTCTSYFISLLSYLQLQARRILVKRRSLHNPMRRRLDLQVSDILKELAIFCLLRHQWLSVNRMI